jgi:NAD(P)H-nitrite reductase large subunit
LAESSCELGTRSTIEAPGGKIADWAGEREVDKWRGATRVCSCAEVASGHLSAAGTTGCTTSACATLAKDERRNSLSMSVFLARC